MEDAPARETHWGRRLGFLIGGGLVSAVIAAAVRKARHHHRRWERLARFVPQRFHLPTLVRH